VETTLAQDRKCLDAAAARLEEPIERTSRTVKGLRNGCPVEFSLLTMGGGWSVRAAAPQVSFAMDVMESVAFDEPRERLVVDASALSSFYSVEGAPENVIANLLDGETCEAIMVLRPRRIFGRRGELTVEKKYSYYYAEPDHIALAIELVVSLSSRVHAAVEKDERELMLGFKGDGSPYRESCDASAVEAAIQRRSERVTAIAKRQDRRLSRSVKVLLAAALGYVIVMGIVLLLTLLS